MSKQCSACGNLCADNAVFCTACGSNRLVEQSASSAAVNNAYSASNQNAYPASNQNPYSAPNQNPYSAPNQNPNSAPNQSPYDIPNQNAGFNPAGAAYAGYNPPPVKKKKTGLIVALSIIGVFVIFAIIGSVLIYMSETDTDSSYTKGYESDGVYINEWANIRFEIPDRLYSTDGSMFENETTECGASYTSLGYEQIAFAYEKLPTAYISEKTYLDLFTDSMSEGVDDPGLMSVPDEYTTYTIAGEEYTAAIYSFVVDFITVNTKVYVRQHGSYMVCIVAYGETESEIDSLVDTIKPVSNGS